MNGLNGIPDNLQLLKLVDDVHQHEVHLKDEMSNDEVFLVAQQCKEEEQLLRVRKRSVETRTRMTIKLNQPLEPLLEGIVQRDDEKCARHPGKSFNHFCKTCNILICTDCTQSNHYAAHHFYVNAALTEAQCKIMLEQLLPKVQKHKADSTQAMNSTENAYCRLHSMIRDTKQKICDQERQEIARIRQKAAMLHAEVTQLGNERANKLEAEHEKHCQNAERAGRTEDIINHAMLKASQLELLKAKDKMINNINSVINTEIIKPLHGLSFMDFAKHRDPLGEVKLGQILLTEKWELLTECKQDQGKTVQVSCVAMYSSGDIAIADMETWQLMVVSRTGQVLRTVKKSMEQRNDALFRPFAFAINTDDELLVIDNSMVKVFDKDMKFLFTVPNSFAEDKTEDAQLDVISCLAVDKQNRIAVGNRGKQIVSLHHQNGQLIQIVPAKMIDTQLTISRGQQLIYTNYEEKKLLSVDLSGQMVFCVNTGKKRPTGVCCDNIGYIYVGMHAEISGQCEIHQYNPYGEFIGCMLQELVNPLGMILTPKDEIIVADMHSVKIYCRV